MLRIHFALMIAQLPLHTKCNVTESFFLCSLLNACVRTFHPGHGGLSVPPMCFFEQCPLLLCLKVLGKLKQSTYTSLLGNLKRSRAGTCNNVGVWSALLPLTQGPESYPRNPCCFCFKTVAKLGGVEQRQVNVSRGFLIWKLCLLGFSVLKVVLNLKLPEF